MEEIIRPRPQGSSPVYECVTEGAGFGLPVSLLARDPQAEGRLRWPPLLLHCPVGNSHACLRPHCPPAIAVLSPDSSAPNPRQLVTTQSRWHMWGEQTSCSCVRRGIGGVHLRAISERRHRRCPTAENQLPLHAALHWGCWAFRVGFPGLPKSLPFPGLGQEGNLDVCGCRNTLRASKAPPGDGGPGGSGILGAHGHSPG